MVQDRDARARSEAAPNLNVTVTRSVAADHGASGRHRARCAIGSIDRGRSMVRILIIVAAALIARPAFAGDEPIVVSANAISGSPATTFQRSGGIDLWQMKWLWDDQKRRLALTVIKSMRPVNADLVSG